MTSGFDPHEHLTQLLQSALAVVAPNATASPALERPKQAEHGDFSCNIAMQLARSLRTSPQDIAQRLIAALPASPWVEHARIAGAGFINFYLQSAAKTAVVGNVLALGDAYGRNVLKAAACNVQVEFVSANPTGPLHVGHGRGAAYGASLAALLAFAGHRVTREYYVNDAGRQMDILALSTWLRYQELGGATIDFPPNAYQGDYVREMARQLQEQYAQRFLHPTHEVVAALSAHLPPSPADDAHLNTTEQEKIRLETQLDALIATAKTLLANDWPLVHRHVLQEQLDDCKNDLAEFGVIFEHWFSERSLFDSGLVTATVAELAQRGHIYEKDGAKWFRSTNFGDEKDRVVQRDNGVYTYFASDIAYHADKFARGFDRIINIWGADHHGYIARVRGALTALGLEAARLDIALVQFVSLYQEGVKVSMSTRSGEYVTLRDLRQDVGNDACRFFYLLRKCDQALDFDLTLAKSESSDNPVYYVQYAYARISSVLKQWGGHLTALKTADCRALTTPRELALCALLGQFPEVIKLAANDYAPHSLAFYLRDLAAEFHAWYNACRLLVDEEDLRLARLALAQAVRQVVKSGLTILGVSAPEVM